MTESDLLNIIAEPSAYPDLADKIAQSAIVNVHTVSGDCIKVKGDKNIRVINITPRYITVGFDSHIVDILFTGIEYVEFFGGLYVRNNNQKTTKR